jgi:hypothetical protein
MPSIVFLHFFQKPSGTNLGARNDLEVVEKGARRKRFSEIYVGRYRAGI